MRVCLDCGIEKMRNEFHIKEGRRLYLYCRHCRAIRRRQRRARNMGNTLESNRQWLLRNKQRAALIERGKTATRTALRNGSLVRPSICETCGRSGRIEAAHIDYSQPLLVRWLCVSCHRRWDHAEPKTAQGLVA